MSWATPALAELAGSVTVERHNDDVNPLAEARAGVQEIAGLRPQLVCPGDRVTAEPGALKGRGVQENEDGKLVATNCGVVEQVNKLVYVRPLKHRYAGSVGDVVVGRIVEVQSERWSVEIGASRLAFLHIGAIQLPGSVQRRRTEEDSLRMREFLAENDTISAEVQNVSDQGQISLQTRSSKYGKLQNGVLVSMPCVCLRRQAQHLLTLPQIGVMVVLGNNGWVWVCAPPEMDGVGHQETMNFSQIDIRYQHVGEGLRERICRVRNTCLALASQGLEVTPESITLAYDRSLECGLAAWELLDPTRCASAGLVEAVLTEATRAEALRR